MSSAELHEFSHEARWEAAPAIALVIAGQILLAVQSRQSGWRLSGLPWWHWLVAVVPELVLLGALTHSVPRRHLERLGHRRTVAILLVAVITVANSVSLAALIGSLVNGHEKSGAELLLKGVVIWGTNVVAFGLWFWELDCGGPVARQQIARRQAPGPPADFQFPQQENPGLAAPGWHPRLFDYVYIAFTNAIAFSPTDAMPLSRRAKGLMLFESATSALTMLLVAARAVNILR